MTATRQDKTPGTIITFYSYKGGTGRSMALANVAWILASNGYRVLTVDWDLEAPGLHRYFSPFVLDRDLTESEGVMEIVTNYVTASMTPADPDTTTSEGGVESPTKWMEPFANVLRYATSLDWHFPQVDSRKGWIDLIPAGKQGPAYASRMNSFSWQNFYDRLGGGGFIEAVKKRMKEEYDYVLIDSRTGVSDTSGICTVQLPDVLAVCFTLNRQSIEGAAAVASSAVAQRAAVPGAGLRVFPIPTRIEKAESEKLNLARRAAKDEFAPLLDHVREEQHEDYWGSVEVLYEPFYAYEEVLSTFRDDPSNPASMVASMERIAGWLTGRPATKLARADEADRSRVLAQYARQAKKAAATRATAPAPGKSYAFFISYARTNLDEYMERFIDDLSREVSIRTGAPSSERVGFVDLDIQAGDNLAERLADSLQRSHVLIPMYSPSYFASQHTGKEFQYFLDRTRAAMETGGRILPVVWVASSEPLPHAAASVQYRSSAFPDAYNRLDLRSLMMIRRYDDAYREFLSAFADEIVKRAKPSARPAPAVASFHDLPSAFVAPAPPKLPAADSTSAEIPPAVRSLIRSISTLEREEVLEIADTILIPHLRGRADPFPLDESRALLNGLRHRRLLELGERVANELIVGGQDSPVVRLALARSLVDQGKMAAALDVLKVLSSDGASSADAQGMAAEIGALVGQAYKTLYVEANNPALPRNQQNLIRAIKAYREPYEANPMRRWHGSNVAALARRAADDGVRLSGIASAKEYAESIATEILKEIDELFQAGEVAPWDYGIAAEMCLVLDLSDDALKWFASYFAEPSVDAFELASFLTQLTKLWRLDASTGIGASVLPVLRARLLEREGGMVTLTADEVARNTTLPQPGEDRLREQIFGSELFSSVDWYRAGLERSRWVARIFDVDGTPIATGFVVRGGDWAKHLRLPWESTDKTFLISAGHVFDSLRDGADPLGFLVSFEALRLAPSPMIRRVAFHSPSDELDVMIASIDVYGVESYPIAKRLPVPGRSRVYMIGHPHGGSLAFSLQDNLVLDHESPRIHYRTPSVAGSSGSPIFNDKWELIGMHHAGGPRPRLHGKPGTYEANEGIWIGAIIEAIAKAKREADS